MSARPKKSNAIFKIADLWVLLGFIVLLIQPLSWNIHVHWTFWLGQGLIWILIISLYLLNSKWLIPQYLMTGRRFTFGIMIVASIIAFSFLGGIVRNFLPDYTFKPQSQSSEIGNINKPPFNDRNHEPVFENNQRASEDMHPPEKLPPPHKRGPLDMFMIIISLLTVGISTSMALYEKWYSNKLKRDELEKENIQSELAYLKAQINPHFFFNTLNNIYSLTYINVEEARYSLHKLSRMMRYLLYDTQNESTQLQKEIEFIKDYIELMKIRIGEKDKIRFTCPDISTAVPISPMILLPFIENAFKHGTANTSSPQINIDINYQEGIFSMNVENTYFYDPSKQEVDEYKGIGMKNTQRRLDLLYPGALHELTIVDRKEENLFIVNLKMQLSHD